MPSRWLKSAYTNFLNNNKEMITSRFSPVVMTKCQKVEIIKCLLTNTKAGNPKQANINETACIAQTMNDSMTNRWQLINQKPWLQMKSRKMEQKKISNWEKQTKSP